MRKRGRELKGFVCGVLVTVLLLSTVMVAASTQTVTREITYGINVMLNGEIVRFDYDTRPFVMGGRTFLPLRTLAELLGLPVDFDPATNTAIVGSRYAVGTRRPLTTVAPHFDTDGAMTVGTAIGVHNRSYTSVRMESSVSLSGQSYPDALIFRTTARCSVGWGGTVDSSRFTLHNLNRQYRLLTGYVGRIDGTHMTDATINFYGDGQLLRTYELYATDLPTPISIFVEGVTQLRIEVVFAGRHAAQATEYALIAFLE